MRIHDLRHTAGTIWLAAGATPAEVRDLLGHCDLAMV
jgi:integrase